MQQNIRSNFDMLRSYEPQLWRLGALAERYFAEDPNTSLLKLRQFAELLAQSLAARGGLYVSQEESQYDLIRRLQGEGLLPREIKQVLDQVRVTGNAANHALEGDHAKALAILKLSWQLSLWFHRTFKQADYRSGPFLPPASPADESAELKQELAALRQAVSVFRAEHEKVESALQEAQTQLSTLSEERTVWEQIATESDLAKVKLAEQLAGLQAQAKAAPQGSFNQFVASANQAASLVQLDEAETRRIIDQQLRQAGWEANTEVLRYSKGTRPQKGRNLAIAEWPCGGYAADYVLFQGLVPMAVVEAKRGIKDVSADLQQAKRYARTFAPSTEAQLHPQGWGAQSEFRIPFVFATNGRPYLRQLATKSGVWFCDLRHPNNRSAALDGWYTPEGLHALLRQDEMRAHAELDNTPFNYGLKLFPFQQDAVRAVESSIERGQREIMLAMATGTGKTKTCIALIYRLLNAQRFKRILFLVDRSALGEQAAGSFKDTRMERLQTFADTFGIKELDTQAPDADTAVHIATVQGMMRRVLFPAEGVVPPPVDQYDCIVIDECHRGYTLDREMSDTELSFRGFDDYISKYRRVLDYFDAVKIGLTATPALHTVDIFGPPVFTYSYREAVVDGYLVDYEPPIQIETKLTETGMVWKVGEEVKVYDVKRNQLDLYKAPDEIKLKVEDFNRKVITRPFNEAVCQYLAQEIDPSGQRKTLIFCVSSDHADMVVDILKAALEAQYGSVEDDAVIKITGNADKPLELIKRYKNERLPNVAVTVDLLTTGIDVPAICNLVFLRQVNSRILFDQMLGRATRRCTFDGEPKDAFRVFDAVHLFENIGNMTDMKPVVVNPKITFAQLESEFAQVQSDGARELLRDQFLAKLQVKKRHLDGKATEDFEAKAGMSPDVFIQKLKELSLPEVAAWFTQNPHLGEILDRKTAGNGQPMYVSDHPDEFVRAERGYGKASKPQDYLEEFKAFINSHGNELPALMAVLTRPRDLTRQQLKELTLALDLAGFSEARLATAWREMSNQDIAARIVGYIRQAALGDALLPYSERVDHALQAMLAKPPGGKPWSEPQRNWLKRIAAQTKANLLVDRAALDDPDLLFKREGGGFARLDRLFNGQLQPVLDAFNDALWAPSAQSA
ncbi:type I restriction-modification system endonuclease [Curvibacter sp. RS43]|uniref:type I restriction-modification system endonuclease n=1 Tax=Curvibacter microcysteis TaxID=3026419 RepID=UPI00235E8179|nr:type I restriction-modification system endonuclease [Curvibacter sp. RS43]MDD0811346.1 type I restriction-modification system endonuclease [Curvibacter sp. RS43]